MKPDYAKLIRDTLLALDKIAAAEGVPRPRKVAVIAPPP